MNADGTMVFEEVKKGEAFTAKCDGVFLPFWYFQNLYGYILDCEAVFDILEEKE